MELKKIIKGSLLSGLLLAPLLIQSVSAQDSTTSDAQIQFTEPTDSPTILDPEDPSRDFPAQDETDDPQVTGNTGPLTIDYVSNLDFGVHKVDVAEATYQATNDLPFVQVSDRRGSGAGWNLTVEASNFTSAGEATLPGAYITLSNGEAVSRLANITAPTVSDSIVVNTGGDAANVATAAVDAGMGSWVTRWSANGQETNPNVELTVPQAAASQGTHNSTLTWTLTDAPGQ